MPFMGINPDCLSSATKEICCEIIGIDVHDPKETQAGIDRELTPKRLARAFNVIDPEVTGLSAALEEKWRNQGSR